jgi:flagellar basal-body rod protein FlgF
MQEVLALSLQSMHTDMHRLDHVATNLANALTPGYKREVVSSQPIGTGGRSFASVVNHLTFAPSSIDSQAIASPISPLLIQADVRPGTLKSTGQSLDLALAGPGYFEVSTEAGPAYTRQGNFHVDARGRLVNANGSPVMGKGGEILLNGPAPMIDSTGRVYESQDGVGKLGTLGSDGNAAGNAPIGSLSIAQLKIVQIEDAQNSQRLGAGLISPGAGVVELSDAEIQIRQGFLENSNVNSMHEMVQLMQTMRHFESMQKVALGYDEMMGQAVRKLGELS